MTKEVVAAAVKAAADTIAHAYWFAKDPGHRIRLTDLHLSTLMLQVTLTRDAYHDISCVMSAVHKINDSAREIVRDLRIPLIGA